MIKQLIMPILSVIYITTFCMENNEVSINVQEPQQDTSLIQSLYPTNDEESRAQTLQDLSVTLEKLITCCNKMYIENPTILFACDDKEQAELSPLAFANALPGGLKRHLIIYCGRQAKTIDNTTNGVIRYWPKKYALIVRNLKALYDYFKNNSKSFLGSNEPSEEFIKYLHSFAPEKTPHALLAGIHTPDIQQIPSAVMEYFGKQVRNLQNQYGKYNYTSSDATMTAAIQTAKNLIPINANCLQIPKEPNRNFLLMKAVQKLNSLSIYGNGSFWRNINSREEVFYFLKNKLAHLSDEQLNEILPNLPIKKALLANAYQLDLEELYKTLKKYDHADAV